MIVEKVELLTKELNPRTKCWKVVDPFRFKGVMEKDEVYPVGWKHRMFFGSRNSRDKKARIDQVDSVEQQVLREQQQAMGIGTVSGGKAGTSSASGRKAGNSAKAGEA